MKLDVDFVSISSQKASPPLYEPHSLGLDSRSYCMWSRFTILMTPSYTQKYAYSLIQVASMPNWE